MLVCLGLRVFHCLVLAACSPLLFTGFASCRSGIVYRTLRLFGDLSCCLEVKSKSLVCRPAEFSHSLA